MGVGTDASLERIILLNYIVCFGIASFMIIMMFIAIFYVLFDL